MSINAGQIVRFSIDGTEYDPAGDWTITLSHNKRELQHTSWSGQAYFSESPQSGIISGSIVVRDGLDIEPLISASDAPVLVETKAYVYQGTVSYNGDPEHSASDGMLAVELTGQVGIL